MKTKEELNALKEEVETLNKKLHELTEEELAQVSGGRCFIVSNGMKRENRVLNVEPPSADIIEEIRS